METEEIQIIAYDGHRAGVRPKAVIGEDGRRDVLDIERAWVETGVDPQSPVSHGFIVRCEGGGRYRVLHHSETGWSAELLPGPRAVR